MNAEDIFKGLFLMLCDTESGKVTVSKRVLQAVPDNWMSHITANNTMIGCLQIKAINPDAITQTSSHKNRPVDMNTETIFKVLFAVLCFQEESEVTTTIEAIDKVPNDWMKMLHLDKPGMGLYRLQVKNEAKLLLWSNDIMVPMMN